METDENYPAQFKNVIEKIIDAELNKRGITKYISALVKSVNDNGTVNVCIPPNLDSIISGLLNKTGETLSEGDSVELCAKNGSVNNSWISIKHKTNNSGVETLDYDSLINKPMVRIVNNDESTPTIIYNLDEGIYSLRGYVKFLVKDADTTLFETPTIMIITSSGEEKYAQIFYPNGNKVVSYRIGGDEYVGTDRGLPSGGTSNQVLAKKSNTDYDTEWKDSIDTSNNLLFYQPGDTFESSYYMPLSGHITASTKNVSLTLVVPKRLDNITSITCNKFNSEARGTGGYLNSQAGNVNYVGLSGYTVECYKATDNSVLIQIRKSSAWTNVENNTPVTFAIGETVGDLKLTFN